MLEQMRTLAPVMKDLEWKQDKNEFVEIGAWEEALSAKQRDTENEHYGRLTYNIDPSNSIEDSDREDEHTHGLKEIRDDLPSGLFVENEHVSVRLDNEPPRFPPSLSQTEIENIKYKEIPRIDYELEKGARPSEIFQRLNRDQRTEEDQNLSARINQAFHKNTDGLARDEHSLNREEELRALYTLRTLSEVAHKSGIEKSGIFPVSPKQLSQLAVSTELIDREINKRNPTDQERASVIDYLSTRISQVQQTEESRLQAYEKLEKDYHNLNKEREFFKAEVRQNPDWISTKKELDSLIKDNHLDQQQILALSNSVRFNVGTGKDNNDSTYRDPMNEGQRHSPFTEVKLESALTEKRVISKLESLLATPALDQQQQLISQQLTSYKNHYRLTTGLEISSSEKAREALSPELKLLGRLSSTLAEERAKIPQVELTTHTNHAKESKEIPIVFVSLTNNNRSVLPIGNFNEYQVLSQTVIKINEQLREQSDKYDGFKLGLRIYQGPSKQEITGYSDERASKYNFLKEYVSFRMQDESTRMRNENSLYREYIERLDNARSLDELRKTANEIRKENYDREKNPERYQDSKEELRLNKHPLSEQEMKKLFLSPAPNHYTDDMRQFRLDRTVSGRNREERIRMLEEGRIEPSQPLQTLLDEFNRVRNSKDIRAFTAQMLNPPDKLPNTFSRFSRENLHEAHGLLQSAEKDYLFQVMQQRRQDLAISPQRDVRDKLLPTNDLSISPAIVKRDSSTQRREEAKLPASLDSPSLQSYTAIATWREADLIARTIDERGGYKTIFGSNRNSIVDGVSDHNLRTASILLSQFKPGLINLTAKELSSSESSEMRKVGEIISTFKDVKEQRLPNGQIQNRITTPEKSELSRNEWDKLLNWFQPTIERDRSLPKTLVPDSLRQDLRQKALSQAWADLSPKELRNPELILDSPVTILKHTLDVTNTVKQVADSQQRTQLAYKAVNDALEKISDRIQHVLHSNHFSASNDRDLIKAIATESLKHDVGTTSSQHLYTTIEKNHPQLIQKYKESGLKETVELIDHSITQVDRDNHKTLNQFALSSKERYQSGFKQIDEQTKILEKVRVEHSLQIDIPKEIHLNRFEKESPSYREYVEATRRYERQEIARELTQMFEKGGNDLEHQVIELNKSNNNNSARNLIPADRLYSITEAAKSKAWWDMTPRELLNAKEDHNKVLDLRLDKAAQRVGEAISAAQIIERGISLFEKEKSVSNNELSTRVLVNSFFEIDRTRRDLNSTREVIAAESRLETFTKVRGEMEQSVGSYLKGVLKEHGELAFEPGKGGVHHAQVAATLMKQVFAKHDIAPETLNLSNERFDLIAKNIVIGLPRELARTREIESLNKQHAGAREELTIGISQSQAITRQPTEMEKSYGLALSEAQLNALNAQLVEKKVSSKMDHTQELVSQVPNTDTRGQHVPQRNDQQHSYNHFDHEITKPKEYTRQHALNR
jgi:hypothetical protein